MYCPHTVSLMNFRDGIPRLTVLHGVMLQAAFGRMAQQRGDVDEVNATLYIPLATVRAVNAAGEEVTFLPPTAYAQCPDPDRHWTLQAEGEGAARGSFLVKGELSEPCTLAEAREQYDYVFVVAGFNLHDYGSPALRHIEVASRITSRYYRY